MKKQIAVIGLGIFGSEVATALTEQGFSVLAIDTDEACIDEVRERVTRTLLMDSTQKRALQDADINEMDTVVVAIGATHQEASIMTVALLKELGVPNIIGRAVSDLHERILRQVGATLVINPEREMGSKIAARIARPSFYEMVQLPDGVCIAEIPLPLSFTGKTLKELDLRRKYNINVLGVQRLKPEIPHRPSLFQTVALEEPARKMITNLSPDEFTFEETDILVVMGRQNALDNL